MTLDVKEIPSKTYDDELKQKRTQYEHVLVYQHQGANTHAVYVEKYDAAKKTVSCINSHGQRDQHPIVSTSDILHLYRVNCIAEDAEKKCSLSPTVAANTKGNAKSSGVYAKKNKISQSASAQPQPTPSFTTNKKSGTVHQVVDPTSSSGSSGDRDSEKQKEAQRISNWTEKQSPRLDEVKSAIQLIKEVTSPSMN